MIESPLIMEIEAKVSHKLICVLLEGRFGPLPWSVVRDLCYIWELEKLDELNRIAAKSRSLRGFHKKVKELSSGYVFPGVYDS